VLGLAKIYCKSLPIRSLPASPENEKKGKVKYAMNDQLCDFAILCIHFLKMGFHCVFGRVRDVICGANHSIEKSK
jgi:hypothetical protein